MADPWPGTNEAFHIYTAKTLEAQFNIPKDIDICLIINQEGDYTCPHA